MNYRIVRCVGKHDQHCKTKHVKSYAKRFFFGNFSKKEMYYRPYNSTQRIINNIHIRKHSDTADNLQNFKPYGKQKGCEYRFAIRAFLK